MAVRELAVQHKGAKDQRVEGLKREEDLPSSSILRPFDPLPLCVEKARSVSAFGRSVRIPDFPLLPFPDRLFRRLRFRFGRRSKYSRLLRSQGGLNRILTNQRRGGFYDRGGRFFFIFQSACQWFHVWHIIRTGPNVPISGCAAREFAVVFARAGRLNPLEVFRQVWPLPEFLFRLVLQVFLHEVDPERQRRRGPRFALAQRLLTVAVTDPDSTSDTRRIADKP